MNINSAHANRSFAATAALLVAAALAACSNDGDRTDNAADSVPVFMTALGVAGQNAASGSPTVEDAAGSTDSTGAGIGKLASLASSGTSNSRNASTGTICVGGEDGEVCQADTEVCAS